jgi:hypothetical protein
VTVGALTLPPAVELPQATRTTTSASMKRISLVAWNVFIRDSDMGTRGPD